MSSQQPAQQESQISNGALLVGAGLALASFIVLPAVAARLGIGSSLTGALRIALMKASTKVCSHSQSDNPATDKSCPPDADCHQ
ncbi:hypothetical protein [methanotrophic endosymbiont of Bathymodiolus puteoserpentis (Logatchev)]|jgi:hypothetical protein|uniref:hypothetical protein n=1 Tax=methanotrophic endosymbiont of Bathymodiolus puteoserpentis (Logatchev) TaxID=343235 RepID=UPI0013CC8918|nr:hypothetical protein [methanotrophic endosymbiont of Bathymodiolus puteoserpentis (Logatchev)]SHE22931.1 hypothetical protein BPUTEOMOX_1836 [methanotrophic endosymbiont of Bathymodiolus puteoserpentis (Logatchev)]